MSINIFLGFGIVCILSIFGSGLGSVRKIVGGSKALPCEDPHIVALKIIVNEKEFVCGGSLLDETHVLTAAHCLNESETVSASVGSLNKIEMPTEIEVESYVLHPAWDINGELGSDLAVLKLTKPIHFTDCIKPIDLAVDDDTKYKNCIISGWGLTGVSADKSNMTEDYLRRAKVNLTEGDICKDIIPAEQKDQLICVGKMEKNGVAGCYGDSGGPLTCEHPLTGRPTLLGVLSWGAKYCDEGITVYTRIPYFKEWIDMTIA